MKAVRERRGSGSSQDTVVEGDQQALKNIIRKRLTPANVLLDAFVKARERRLIRSGQECMNLVFALRDAVSDLYTTVEPIESELYGTTLSHILTYNHDVS